MSKKSKSNDNTWMWVLLGLLGVGGTVGVVSVVRSRRGENQALPAGGSDTPRPESLAELAAQLRVAHLKIEGCSVSWKSGDTSRMAVLSQREELFVSGILDGRAKGLLSLDELTSHVAGLLVPGCPWPPQVLEPFDLDAALAGELNALETQAWSVVQAFGVVRVYLDLRQVVGDLLTQTRRG